MNATRSTPVYSSCPVCGGKSLTGRWEVNGYTIASCNACSLVFIQNQVTTEELAAHYASVTDDAYDDANVECPNHYYEKLWEMIRSRYPRPGKLLDIGCSRGWFLDVMTGWERHGNEISSAYAATACERYGDRIVIGPFEDYPMRENYFDVITLQDVFDHIRDPIPILEKCHRLLRPGGLIVIKVHNISCLYAKISGKSFYAVVPPTHLFYYDGHTLDLALSNSGFQVVDSRFIGHLFKVKTVFLRLSRGDIRSLSHRIYRTLNGTELGEVKFHKNLHDIITVLGVTQE